MKRAIATLLIIAAALWILILPLSAHEGREIEGYTLFFGWRAEPAFVGYLNGPEIFIEIAAAAKPARPNDYRHEEEKNPLESVDVDLQIEVSFGPVTKTLPLELNFGTFDNYVATLIPTRPGDYTFRVFGMIGDVAVDEIFSSSAGEFSSVEPAADVTFPDEVPSIVELLEQIAALEARIAALEG
ncbi:MAG: hypothetical protein SGJ24_11050 [Chloroflexota bacterium]|nr:hypothetical protein [Chloroflexota bacterium]